MIEEVIVVNMVTIVGGVAIGDRVVRAMQDDGGGEFACAETGLAHVADKVELGELVARYAWLVGQGRGIEVPALFTPDGRFQGRGHDLRGQADLQAFYSQAASQPGDTVPVAGNFLFRVNGDSAVGVSTLAAFGRRTGQCLFTGYYVSSPHGLCQ